MTELSLNILDIAENSIRAEAKLIIISLLLNTAKEKDSLTITINDDGKGMSPEQVSNVTDPFFTSRTTRKVGLGTSLFKQAAELTGGFMKIESTLGKGTNVTAVFGLSSIDRPPLGDIAETIRTLAVFNETGADIIFSYDVDGKNFEFNTREFKEILETDTLNIPEVSVYVRDFLKENIAEINGDYSY